MKRTEHAAIETTWEWIETDCNVCDGDGWIEVASEDPAPPEVRCPRCNPETKFAG